ncbi:head GIN domain-containing protein [Parasediminibacterium paludis]|uniref:Head GIN domain-containing protein n=1 Tax=Parasediminibacterium paludis TaxID=908966 RepID=A0ABV8PVZ8_9BACT
MKTVFIALLAITSFTTIAQPWRKIEGNGNLTKNVRTVDNFTSIGSGGSWDVIISYGTDKEVTIEADENLIPYIITEVKGGKLNIRTENYVNLKSKNKIKIYVSLTEITGISLAGSGNITGVGNFTNDDKTTFSVAGSGNINLDFKGIQKVGISIAGSGNVILKGKTEALGVSISGSGDAICKDLVADDVKVSIAGSGSAKVNASNGLKVSVVGSGDVFYTGTVTNISKSIAGSGKVIKL